MTSEYIDERDGGLYLAGTRVSLDSVIHAFNRGTAPESILRSFELIGSLERVYGAITYYLANKDQVDEYLDCQRILAEKLRAENPLPAELQTRLARARQAVPQR